MDPEDLFESPARRDWDTGPDGSVRLAVVGIGGFSRNVALPAIAGADYCEPAVLVTGSPAATGDIAGEYDAELVDYEAYADGAVADLYDAVYIGTPNALHLPHAETAAELGKDVICEKPLEATVDRGERLVETCAEAGVTLMTAYRMQADPVMRRVRSYVGDGGLGRVTHVYSDFTYAVLGGSRGPDQWRLDPELAGGGALADIGIYPLNTARFVLDADPVSARGVASGEGPFAGVDETVGFLLEFPDGASAACTASFTGPRNTHFAVSGSEGRLVVEAAFDVNAGRTVRVETDEGTDTFADVGTEEVREEFDYFAHCVLTGTAPEPDGEDGLVDLRTMAVIYRDAGLDVPMAAE